MRVLSGGSYRALLEGWGMGDGEGRLEGGRARNLEVEDGGGAKVGKKQRFFSLICHAMMCRK